MGGTELRIPGALKVISMLQAEKLAPASLLSGGRHHVDEANIVFFFVNLFVLGLCSWN